MAGNVVARGDGIVADRIGTDEADLAIATAGSVVSSRLSLEALRGLCVICLLWRRCLLLSSSTPFATDVSATAGPSSSSSTSSPP